MMETRFARAAIRLADLLDQGADPAAALAELLAARRAVLAGTTRDARVDADLARTYDATRHAAYRCASYGGRPRRPVFDPDGRRFGSRAEAAAAWGMTAQGVGKLAAARAKGWRCA